MPATKSLTTIGTGANKSFRLKFEFSFLHWVGKTGAVRNGKTQAETIEVFIFFLPQICLTWKAFKLRKTLRKYCV